MAANENKELADRLRGLSGQSRDETRQLGQQLFAEKVKMQTVSEVSGPAATPTVQQQQAAPAAKYRHIQELQQQQMTGGPVVERSTSAVGGERSVADIAKSLRQVGVSQARSAAEVSRPAHNSRSVETTTGA